MSIFSRAEIERRWAGVLQRMGDADCAVVPSFCNSYYLSGVPVYQAGRWAITILFKDGHTALIIPAFEKPAADRLSPISDVRTYIDDDGPNNQIAFKHVAEVLKERDVKTIGVEAEGMPCSMYFELNAAFPDSRVVDVTRGIESVRSVSSAEEIRYLRESARIADLGMVTALEILEGGVTETDVSVAANAAMQRESTSEFMVTRANCYMQQGARSIEAHTGSVSTEIVPGGMVQITAECEIWHYWVGVERGVLVGDVSEELERLYLTTVEACRVAREAIRPGVTFAAIHALARNMLRDAGYKDIDTGSGGLRGLALYNGYGRIEAGNFRLHNSRLLQPGMVLTIEPWAQVAGVGGPRHADPLLVTESAHEVLSTIDPGALRVVARTGGRGKAGGDGNRRTR